MKDTVWTQNIFTCRKLRGCCSTGQFARHVGISTSDLAWLVSFWLGSPLFSNFWNKSKRNAPLGSKFSNSNFHSGNILFADANLFKVSGLICTSGLWILTCGLSSLWPVQCSSVTRFSWRWIETAAWIWVYASFGLYSHILNLSVLSLVSFTIANWLYSDRRLGFPSNICFSG